MAIWEFNNEEQFPTAALQRVIEIDKELKDLLGDYHLDEDMMIEIKVELINRAFIRHSEGNDEL